MRMMMTMAGADDMDTVDNLSSASAAAGGGNNTSSSDHQNGLRQRSKRQPGIDDDDDIDDIEGRNLPATSTSTAKSSTGDLNAKIKSESAPSNVSNNDNIITDDFGRSSARNSNVTTVARPLDSDSYSLFFVYQSMYRSTFLFAMGIFLFQSVIFSMFLVDIIDLNIENPFRIPPGCSTIARAMQPFALMVALLNNGEIVSTVAYMNAGWKKITIIDAPKHCDRNRWMIMITTHFLEGVLALLVNFILIIQSTAAKPLFLSLSATAIISKVDDLTFAIASQGFITSSLQTRTEQVSKIKIRSSKIRNQSRTIFMFIYCCLLAGWLWVVVEQNRGAFIPYSIEVGFGTDNFLGYYFEHFSGPYDLQLNEMNDPFQGNTRGVYLERRYDPERSLGRGQFSFCKEDRRWVFSVIDNENIDPSVLPSTGTTCNWLFRTSKKTESYDVSEFSTQTSWERWVGRQASIDYLKIENADCINAGDCFNRGTCNKDTRRCTCDDGWVGQRCQFPKPCATIESLSGVPSSYDGNTLPAKFTTIPVDNLQDLETYGFPVYTHRLEDSDNLEDVEHFALMYFTGRRWFAGDVYVEEKDLGDITAIQDHLKNYHAQWHQRFPRFITQLKPRFASAFTTAGKPTDLRWYRYRTDDTENVEIDGSSGSGVIFTCKNCTKQTGIVEDSCSFGECLTIDADNNVNECKCISGYTGPGCDIPPNEDASKVSPGMFLTFDDGSSNCSQCPPLPPGSPGADIYEGDCHAFPYVDPITMDGSKVRFAVGYNGTAISVYSITDDVLYQHIGDQTKSEVFAITDVSSKSEYFAYHREMCDENIATLVGTMVFDEYYPNSEYNDRSLVIELDEAGNAAVIKGDSYVQADPINGVQSMALTADGTYEPLCPSISTITFPRCMIPGEISSMNTKKVWITLFHQGILHS